MRTTTEIIAEIKQRHPRVLYVDPEQTPERLEELLAEMDAGLIEHVDDWTDEELSEMDAAAQSLPGADPSA